MHTVWQEKFAVGIDSVDQQHKHFVACVSALDEAIHQQGQAGHAFLWRVFHEIAEYAASHFVFEETIMREAGYPGLQAHKNMHELFIRRVNSQVRRFDAG